MIGIGLQPSLHQDKSQWQGEQVTDDNQYEIFPEEELQDMQESGSIYFADGDLFFSLLCRKSDQWINTESGNQDTEDRNDTEYAEDHFFRAIEFVDQIG